MSDKQAFDDLIRRVQQRSVWNLILGQAALSVAVATAGFVVLLVVGTQILDWPWLVFLFLGSLVFGLFRTLRRIPQAYLVAQRVDRALELSDTLSTALFFHDPGRQPRNSSDIVEAQRHRAEQISRELDAKQAAPLAVPRSLHAAAVLAAVALGLFGLRFGLSRSLDLRPPIVRAAAFDIFRVVPHERASLRADDLPQQSPELLANEGLDLDRTDAERSLQVNSQSDPGLITGEVVDARKSGRQALSSDAQGTDEREPFSGRPELPGDPSSESAAQDSNQPGNLPPKPPSSSSGENSSLMEKLRDAMADLLSRLKIQPQFGESRQAAANSQGGLEAGRQRQAPGHPGEPGSERQLADSGGAGDQQAGEEGSDNAQAGRGKSGEKASGEQVSGQERSGMGKEEGSKEIRRAEQLAAMGKISEIIGKRAENVTGEVMVEVSSGRQQDLKTPYSQRRALHSEAGGEIHRDEVPLIFQNYVQQYFEQVRKAPPPLSDDGPRAAGETGQQP